MKLKRSYLMHYIDASFGGSGSPKWFLLGKDIEEMSVELNPDTETVKNILDETSVNDNGYEPSMSADPYYANPDDAIYEHLSKIAMNRLTGEDCKTKILEVLIEGDTESTHKAWTEDVVVKPQSYGGSQGGINIPFDVTFNGNRKEGTVKIASGVPTFTEGAASQAQSDSTKAVSK
ncbi:hypothetical protein [Eubacterium sp.]|jgi:hypothetical protein|uniref:hypothetical protein n=1 Tax=Eubacterium sp. TaxID=142586 RepID=UPI001D2DFFC9|nr:hypothetical protein [Eubacterium sp.]MBS5620423.1 hypothetical protein [Eubacterium sp.]DAI62367.1 MAG TPA: hypothetical protein [Caudoviricetes sp.]